MNAERICDHENQTDERREQHVHRQRYELLHIAADLLKLAECLSASLVLEYGIGKLERVTNTVGIHLRAKALNYDVDKIVLEVLGYPRDERNPDSSSQQQRDPANKLTGRVFLEPGRVRINYVAEDQRIQEREHLIDRRQCECERDELPVFLQIVVQNIHQRRSGELSVSTDQSKLND